MTTRRAPCDVPWYPHGLARARLYPCGTRCDRHAPWALAGKPEPPPRPAYAPPATPTPNAASALIDNRAIASGKRRSTPQAYRAAQAATRPKGPRQ